MLDDKMQAFDDIRAAARAELEHIRKLGADEKVVFVSSNLGAYEAVLLIICSGEAGIPVYEVIKNVQTKFTTQVTVVSRIRAMRKMGLILERSGQKKSQVCLAPSEGLLRAVGPILLSRCCQ